MLGNLDMIGSFGDWLMGRRYPTTSEANDIMWVIREYVMKDTKTDRDIEFMIENRNCILEFLSGYLTGDNYDEE